MNESAVLFGETDALVGILTEAPDTEPDPTRPALVVLNDGLIHRVGPHRLYVKLARQLAAMGVVVLRFDFSGVGDSPVRSDNLPYEQSAVSETQDAMSFLHATRGIDQFILIGMCSGGMRAFHTACRDPRVVGVILIDIPWLGPATRNVESYTFVQSRRVVRSYWKRAVSSPRSWLRAMMGKTEYRTIMRAIAIQLSSLLTLRRKQLVSSTAHEAISELHGLTERDVRLLLIYSENFIGLEYLHVILGEKMHGLRTCGKVQVEIIPGAAGAFTLLESQKRLCQVIDNWVQAFVQH